MNKELQSIIILSCSEEKEPFFTGKMYLYYLLIDIMSMSVLFNNPEYNNDDVLIVANIYQVYLSRFSDSEHYLQN